MEIHSETLGDILILRPQGRLDHAVSPQMRELVETAITNGVFQVLLDFSMTHAVSSHGLRAILESGAALRQHGGQIVLAGLPETILPLFRISGILALFPSFDSAQQALQHFGSGAA